MRYLTLIFFLAMGLATAARVQNFTVEIDPTSPVPGNLNFNPTDPTSPYPYRVFPTKAPAVALDTRCYILINGQPIHTQGSIPSSDNTLRKVVDSGCYKSFPQFFKPLESASSDNTYVLRVCNKQNTASRFTVSVAFTAPVPANSDFPVNQFIYRGRSAPSGIAGIETDWTNASTSSTPLFTSTPALPPSTSPDNCTTLTAQLRLRLDGNESFLNSISSLTSKVTFTVAVFP